MSFEHRIFQNVFAPTDLVVLRQVYFTPGQVFEPGVYYAGQLPGAVFDMGLVDQLPPVRGKSAELRPRQHPEPQSPEELTDG